MAESLGVLILQYQERFLFVKRHEDDDLYPGLWSPIIEHLEENESPQDGLKRASKAEAGLSEDELKLIEEYKMEVSNPKTGKKYDVYSAWYRTETNKVKLNEENEDYAWVPLGEIPSYDLVPEFKMHLEKFMELVGTQ